MLLILTFSLFFIFICLNSSLKYFNCSIFTIHFSDSCNSSTSSKLKLLIEKSNTFSDLLGIICFFCSVLIFHFSISAIIRFILNQHEYFSSIFPKRLSLTAILFVFTCLFNFGSSGYNDSGTKLVSHDDCGLHNNFEPWNHLSILTNFLKLIPRETSSAGFSFDEIYFHWLTCYFRHASTAIFLYHVLSVRNKGLECSPITSNVPQNNPAVSPEIFIKFLQL